MESTKPQWEQRLGNIRVAVWENTTGDRKWWSTSITRRFKVGDEWKTSSSFNGVADLAVVKEAAEMAQQWIHRQEVAPNGQIAAETSKNVLA